MRYPQTHAGANSEEQTEPPSNQQKSEKCLSTEE